MKNTIYTNVWEPPGADHENATDRVTLDLNLETTEAGVELWLVIERTAVAIGGDQLLMVDRGKKWMIYPARASTTLAMHKAGRRVETHAPALALMARYRDWPIIDHHLERLLGRTSPRRDLD